jgi:hypothetical protein
MHPDEVIDSLGAHMDALQAIFSWGVVLALGIGWAGIRNATKIEIGKLEMGRREAFYVASVAYALGVMAFVLALLRIKVMLEAVPDAEYVEAYSKVATHEWLQNPFGFFGKSADAQASSAGGIGMLVVGWWICATAVGSLRIDDFRIWRLVWLAPFYAVGLFSLWLIWLIYVLNLKRLQAVAPTLYGELDATADWRWIAAWAGLLVGVAVVLIAIALRKRVAKAAPAAES